MGEDFRMTKEKKEKKFKCEREDDVYRPHIIDGQPTSTHKAPFLHRWQTWLGEARTPTC